MAGNGLAVFVLAAGSGAINILMLSGAIYMLQIYDRILSSQSVHSLIVISAIVFGAFVLMAVLDTFRMRILVLISERFGRLNGAKAHTAVIRNAQIAENSGLSAMQPVSDMETVRSFIASPAPIAFFDLPWMPIFILVCFILHPVIGWYAIGCALLLVFLTLYMNWRTSTGTKRSDFEHNSLLASADTAQKGRDVLTAMGMVRGFTRRWEQRFDGYMEKRRKTAFQVVGLMSLAKSSRLMLQSGALGIGAYLAILEQITPGAVVAGSILITRALGPLDQALAGWSSFVLARQAAGRLGEALMRAERQESDFELPTPHRSFEAQNVTVAAPDSGRLIISGINFKLMAGQALGIIGPSASGKSSLIRALVGIWPVRHGKVRVDGASLDQWQGELLGSSIGYLPQDVQLFTGTVAENIARFQDSPDSEEVIAAAQAAGFHEHVVALPNGYETPVGHSGAYLSSGQKQRLGLARALYKRPFLIVLDEPNANLDGAGDQALARAIQAAREWGSIVVIAAHRSGALASVDRVLTIREGRMVNLETIKEFGERYRAARRRGGKAAVSAEPLQVVKTQADDDEVDHADD
ncbi:MAG: type I secretion system permease/ATPase [Pseudomonadota bacterium]